MIVTQIMLCILIGATIDTIHKHIKNKLGIKILTEVLQEELVDRDEKEIKYTVYYLYFKFLSVCFVKSAFFYIIPSILIVYLLSFI